jgi:hypothetical protein
VVLALDLVGVAVRSLAGSRAWPVGRPPSLSASWYRGSQRNTLGEHWARLTDCCVSAVDYRLSSRHPCARTLTSSRPSRAGFAVSRRADECLECSSEWLRLLDCSAGPHCSCAIPDLGSALDIALRVHGDAAGVCCVFDRRNLGATPWHGRYLAQSCRRETGSCEGSTRRMVRRRSLGVPPTLPLHAVGKVLASAAAAKILKQSGFVSGSAARPRRCVLSQPLSIASWPVRSSVHRVRNGTGPRGWSTGEVLVGCPREAAARQPRRPSS